MIAILTKWLPFYKKNELFTLAKQIQCKWPDTYGEDKLVVMFGGGVAY